MLLTDILKRNARVYPNEVALIQSCPKQSKRKEITWLEFNKQADAVAAYLIENKLEKGSRVIILLENCIEWLPIYFGILRAGCIVVPIDYSNTYETILYRCTFAQASAIVFGSNNRVFIETLQQSNYEWAKCFVEVGDSETCASFADNAHHILANPPAESPRVSLEVLDDAALYFTSGSTNIPKAILLTHRNLEFSCYLENHHHRQVHDDNFLCLAPLFHTGALMHWFGGFIVGAKAVILRTLEAKQILQAISDESVTIVWFLVPVAKEILCCIENGSLDLDSFRLEQWRLVHIGAQPVSPNLISEWISVFPHHEYNTTYGLTETTGPGCIQLGINNFHKIGAIGKPGFDWEVRIVDEALRQVPDGMHGRLMLKGPGVMKCYYKDPEKTKKHLIDGWFLTDDIAMRDGDGYIWYVDREDDVINVNERLVYPVEIENFLLLHQHIQDAAVFGLSVKNRQMVTALIQPKPNQSLDSGLLQEFCLAMPRYKRPEKFFFGKVIRGLTGKIKKYDLKKYYAQLIV